MNGVSVAYVDTRHISRQPAKRSELCWSLSCFISDRVSTQVGDAGSSGLVLAFGAAFLMGRFDVFMKAFVKGKGQGESGFVS